MNSKLTDKQIAVEIVKLTDRYAKNKWDTILKNIYDSGELVDLEEVIVRLYETPFVLEDFKKTLDFDQNFFDKIMKKRKWKKTDLARFMDREFRRAKDRIIKIRLQYGNIPKGIISINHDRA